MEKLDPIRIYQMATEIATQWNRRLVKGEKGENIIFDALMKEGYEITSFPMIKEGEVSFQRKKEKLKESRFPDALARYHGDLDPKFKSKKEYLGVVNVNDYNGYVKFLRNFTVQVPFKIFFYLNDLKEIWVHDLRKPYSDPSLELTITTLRGKPVYQIFRSELKLWKSV
jgi:hypothetical protein